MLNFSLIILSFIAGYFFQKYKVKIFKAFSQFKFFIVHYKEITQSKTYNEFYEDYITQKDFVKEVDDHDE